MDYATIALLICGVLWKAVPRAEGIEVNLTNTRLATTDLNWYAYPSDGTGWNEVSNADEHGVPFRTFQVCNIRTPGQNNWVKTNYIPLEKGVKNVYVEIKFNIRSCQDLPHVTSCKETFNLYYMEVNSSGSGKGKVLNEKTYTKIDTIAADQGLPSGTHEASIETRKIGPIYGNGIHIAFQDTGACMLIYYVRVYYKKCEESVKNLARFPSTLTGYRVTSLVKIAGNCVPNAVWSEMIKGPTLHCNSEGNWNLAEGTCKCLPGYQPNEETTQCIECPRHQYKSSVGNDRCLSCPKNSVTITKGSKKCMCRLGFYRSLDDKPDTPCAKPPSEPEMVQYVVQETSVEMKWLPPNYFGGRNDVFYSISCRRCDSTYTLCSECADVIDYEPGGRVLVEPSVTIQGLSPHTYYRFRIFSHNGVSKASGQEPAYADAMLKTSEAAPSVITSVQVIKRTSSSIMINWVAPSSPYGIIQEYEVQYSSKDKSLPRISRYNKTKTQSFKIRNLPAGMPFSIQVRARNGAGFGPFSSPIEASTIRDAPNFLNPANLGNSPLVKYNVFEEDIAPLPGNGDYLPMALAVAFSSALLIAVISVLLVVRARRLKEQKLGCKDVEVYPFFENAADLLHAQRERRSYVDPTSYSNPHQAVHDFAREIDTFNIKKETLLGSGEFGDVYKGIMRPTSFIYDGTFSTTTSTRSNHLAIAIKVLKDGATEEQKHEFLEEALVMGQFNHPNVIRLEGVVTRTTPLMIVTEYMENGSLDKFLENGHVRGMELEIFQLVNMLRDIADGMRYLCDMGYVHRDLAARNILVNDQLVCKVSDFGLSRILENVNDEDTAMYKTKSGLVPIRWTAPEAITQRTFTSASDVWSYGIVIWEVLTHGERPYWEMSNPDVVHCVECGYRLPPPPFCPRVLHNLMLNCWNMDRTRRPTFKQIVTQLDSVLVTPERLQDTINNTPIQEQVECVPESLDISSLCQWLEDMNMTHYKDIMLRHGCVTAEQITRLTTNQLDEMGIIDEAMQHILLNGAELLRQKLQEVNMIGIGITV